jgi:hypothetical protein
MTNSISKIKELFLKKPLHILVLLISLFLVVLGFIYIVLNTAPKDYTNIPRPETEVLKSLLIEEFGKEDSVLLPYISFPYNYFTEEIVFDSSKIDFVQTENTEKIILSMVFFDDDYFIIQTYFEQTDQGWEAVSSELYKFERGENGITKVGGRLTLPNYKEERKVNFEEALEIAKNNDLLISNPDPDNITNAKDSLKRQKEIHPQIDYFLETRDLHNKFNLSKSKEERVEILERLIEIQPYEGFGSHYEQEIQRVKNGEEDIFLHSFYMI